jgi:hypothetical protein
LTKHCFLPHFGGRPLRQQGLQHAPPGIGQVMACRTSAFELWLRDLLRGSAGSPDMRLAVCRFEMDKTAGDHRIRQLAGAPPRAREQVHDRMAAIAKFSLES